jgi:hypothetical protein
MNLFDKFMQIFEALNEEKVEYILIGGFAVILYGSPRLTQDIDIFLKMNDENISKLKNAFKRIYEDDSIDEITFDELEKYPVIRYGTPDDFHIDIISKLVELFNYKDLEFTTEIFQGIPVRIATPEILLKLKKSTVRPDDQMDAIFIIEKLINKNQ